MNTPSNTTHDCILVSYDIPSKLSVRPAPFHVLPALGFFRVNLSVWCGTRAALGRAPIDKWMAAGASVNVIEFKPTEWDKLRALAEQALAEDLNALRDHMAKHLAAAEQKFADAEREQSAKLVAKTRGRLAGLAREAKRRVAAAEAACLLFDLTATRDDLLTAFRETAAAYQDAYAAVRKTKTTRESRKQMAETRQAEAALPEPEPQPMLFLTPMGLEEVDL